MIKIKLPVLIAGLSFSAFALASQTSAFASKGEAQIQGSISVNGIKTNQYPNLAKIKAQEASTLAMQVQKGNVLSVGLEGEDGYLVYAVEVAGEDSHMHEILIDAGNGKVLADQTKNSSHHEDNDDEEED